MNDSLALVRSTLGAGLQSVLMFGSCLSERIRRPDSIPDFFGFVDDLDDALLRLGQPALTRHVARLLPPITLALAAPRGRRILAKLNLVEPQVAACAMSHPRDVYLIGRLSKRTETLFVRDDAAQARLIEMLEGARRAIVDLVLLDLPPRCRIDDAVRRCTAISYAGEPRPETPARIAAVHDSFAEYYADTFRPLLISQSAAHGYRRQGELLIDELPGSARRSARAQLRRFLRRSRLRTCARWPKQALVYRGWLPYVIDKIRRARSP